MQTFVVTIDGQEDKPYRFPSRVEALAFWWSTSEYFACSLVVNGRVEK